DRRWLDLDTQFSQRTRVADRDLVFRHVAAGAADVLDRAWKNVHAAHDDHVVCAAQDTPFQREGVATALTGWMVDGWLVLRSSFATESGWLMDRFDQVPRAITQQGRADAAKGRQHQFASLTGRDRLAGTGVDDFREVSRLEHVQHTRLLRAFVGHRSGFGHAVMIEDPRSMPPFLQARPQGGDAPSGFAGD